jgi:hypothetical protein
VSRIQVVHAVKCYVYLWKFAFDLVILTFPFALLIPHNIFECVFMCIRCCNYENLIILTHVLVYEFNTMISLWTVVCGYVTVVVNCSPHRYSYNGW